MTNELGGPTRISWIPISNTLALAAVAPFCGYMQDIFGKRNITLFGCVCIMVGIIIVGTAHSFRNGVVGMSLAGAGAAIGELSALAGYVPQILSISSGRSTNVACSTAELVPVNKRGLYLAIVTFFVVPFTPYVMYSQLLGTYSTWRWGQWISLIWNVIGFVGLLFTYFPQSQLRDHGATWKDAAAKIDYVGACLSIIGLTLFLVALQAGGYSHPWTSAYVLSTLLIGLVMIFVWVIWEWKFAKFPMIPKELFAGQKIMGTAFFIAFVAGMNFYSLLNFFPLTFTALYNPDPIQVGLKGLGYGLSVTVGATLANGLLSVWKGHNKAILLFSCILMTAFGGALACLTPENPKTAVALGTICGFGVGGVLVPAATIAITVSPDHLIATTVALALSIRVVGGSIGYSIYYNIFLNKLTPALPAYIAQYAVAAGLPESSAVDFVTTYLTAPANISNVAGVNPAVLLGAVQGSRWAYAYALKYVWYVSIPFGVLACIACALLGDIAKYMTNRIAAVNRPVH